MRHGPALGARCQPDSGNVAGRLSPRTGRSSSVSLVRCAELLPASTEQRVATCLLRGMM